ncbi:hypothetical protein GCM10009843_30450 [Nocardioides bigeumensis]|uniref:Uncharacterized protein n=1 Tax=Nocardioides bigeumensis TaxID=433657 RepID=A0ABN2YLA8_9ACTN
MIDRNFSYGVFAVIPPPRRLAAIWARAFAALGRSGCSPDATLVFTPKPVVQMMSDALEAQNPGIFSDPDRTFADLFSTAGLFLMELVRRLDKGLADAIPDQDERLRHILTRQVFEMSHNAILHDNTLEAVSGGVPERRAWLVDSGHFQVGNLAHMTSEERDKTIAEMLGDS